MAGLFTALLAGTQLVLGPAPAANPGLAVPSTVSVSSPRESLPQPVHDEATCAFCQAAAFAPLTSGPQGTLVIDVGDERRIQLTSDHPLTSSASAGPARSRAPPVIRSV
jgi:hypothetical protein